MNKFRKFKIVFLSLLLPAFLLLEANAVLNWHVHKFADGSIIVHAHPFQKSGNSPLIPPHHHSAKACFSIQHLTGFLFALEAAFFLALCLVKLVDCISSYEYCYRGNIQEFLLPNRAPPFFV
ncbi:hypothetical protein [Ancylomarina longa]|uniref:Transmembrane protein n=1 Tax=Ancylomarina longa TaxID=2487017 RepID=A0A434ATS7_9BACT|nr:hypothetical protein [Ancylomarina longa]RUT77726.1 hypothetical protein DLK05_11705 [Ancylomarina longa]